MQKLILNLFVFIGLIAHAENVSNLALERAFNSFTRAGSTIEQQLAQKEVLKEAAKLLVAHGYVVSAMKVASDKTTPVFNIESGPSGTTAAQFIKQLKHDGIEVQIGGVDNGIMIYKDKVMMLSPLHALLGRDIYSTTMAHEFTHHMNQKNINRGMPSGYDAEIRNLDGAFEQVTAVGAYSTYLHFSELLTHKNDVQALLKGEATVETLMNRQVRENVIAQKQKTVGEIAKAIRTAVAVPKTKTVFGVDEDYIGVIKADLYFAISKNKQAILRVWLPELKPQTLESLSQSQLDNALAEKISMILKATEGL